MNRLNKIFAYIDYKLNSKTAHGVHSPFVSKFIHELLETSDTDYYQFTELNEVRKKLLSDTRELTITDFGAGSKVFRGNKRRICDIAKHGISQAKFSELYFKMVNFCNAKHVVELGTSLGLNTLYLAKANSACKVYSIEGSKELYDQARNLMDSNKVQNTKLINDTFENALPGLFRELPTLDLYFVDGNHRYEPTMNYFKLGLEKKHQGSVFIFDDIHWSDEMLKAWNAIRTHSEVTLSLDLYYVGIVFFRQEQKQKEHFVLRY